jgi:S-adenosylmethionine:tRNA ribosyltransferase-isomerase
LRTFDYELPADRIAQVPVEPRSAARLLVALSADPAHVSHRTVADLPDFVESGDLLVLNTTRVMPARLDVRKATGGRVEVLVLSRDGADRGTALVRPSRRVPPGTVLLAEGEPVVEVREELADGVRAVRLLAPLEKHGAVPLPPYIEQPLDDDERYQTVYAQRETSVAAPTAGLHLTGDVLDRCRARGASIATLELSVGLATFKPITAARVEDHRMHHERYDVPAATLDAARAARRVVAIGTTTVRALESAARFGLQGSTDLFIHAPFDFQVVDVLMTNFHMPRSSLLLMLDAFCGPRWRALYDIALAEGYRFLSFGDAMLVSRA